MGDLFGRTGERSRLWVTDAESAQISGEILQTFVAIDRFTGGGEPTKLYKARAAECEALSGNCIFDPRRGAPEDWEKGLLLLVARDALEGELSLGWGKARGYGACDVVLEGNGAAVGDWDGLLAYLDTAGLRDSARDWIAALHQHIEDQLPAGADRQTPASPDHAAMEESHA